MVSTPKDGVRQVDANLLDGNCVSDLSFFSGTLDAASSTYIDVSSLISRGRDGVRGGLRGRWRGSHGVKS